MVWRGAATAPRQIEKAALGEAAKILVHILRRFIVFAKGIGQPGVKVGTEVAFGDGGQLLKKRPDFLKAASTVAADDERAGVGDGVPERLRALPG